MIQSLQNFFQRYYILLLTIFFIVSGGYLLVTEFWYFGTVKFYVSEKNTVIKIEQSGENSCSEKICSYELIPGKYKFSVEKENFNTFFGEMEISMQEISEQKIILSRKSTQISQKIGKYKKKTLAKKFSLKGDISGKIGEKIPENSGFSIEKNIVKYRDIPLLNASDGKFFVSSDEVGRGYWVVSPEKIQLFRPDNQDISTHIKKNRNSGEKIKGFLALQDGSFITEISGKGRKNRFFWKPFSQPEKRLDITPFSLESVCKSGDVGGDESFVFLEEKNEGNFEVEVKKKNILTGEIVSWGILENFSLEDFHSIQCIGTGEVILFFYKNDSISVKRG